MSEIYWFSENLKHPTHQLSHVAMFWKWDNKVIHHTKEVYKV